LLEYGFSAARHAQIIDALEVYFISPGLGKQALAEL
jgi:hypothetical protein